MKKIASAHLTHFRGEAHLEFMELVSSLLRQSPATQRVVAAKFPTFNVLVEQEAALVDAARKSDLTLLIEDADHRVDRDITGIRGAVASAVHHYDPTTVAAAVSLQNRLKAFGDIAKKTYAQEVAAVNILIADLHHAHAAQATVLGLGGWVEELAQAEADFEALLARRTTEQAEASAGAKGRLKSLRRDIDIVYHAMTDRIDAAATIDAATREEAEAYAAFVAQLNANIAYFNEHDDHHHIRRDLSTANVADIPPQPHTGEPVVLLPTVHCEGKKLAFSVDYTLTYRHNTEVGTADLTIHGKGAYKGQRTITFSIA